MIPAIQHSGGSREKKEDPLYVAVVLSEKVRLRPSDTSSEKLKPIDLPVVKLCMPDYK